MNREQFMTKLDQYLHVLSQAERQDVLRDFEEHFSVGLAKGETEEYIAASLGSPKKIAEDILMNSNVDNDTISKKLARPSDTQSLFIGILLIIFNLIFIVGPYVGLLGVVFSFWVTGFVFIVSPLLTLFKALFLSSVPLFEWFLSIGLTGLGILLVIGMYYVTQFVIQLTIRYVKFNIRLAKGE